MKLNKYLDVTSQLKEVQLEALNGQKGNITKKW